MKWPWSKEIAAARVETKQAAESHAHSVQRRMQSERQESEAVEVTDALWEELRLNGWTEKLQRAWGGSR